MKYLPILFALLFAAPAGAVCEFPTVWPACTVQFTGGRNLEDRYGFFDRTICSDNDTPGTCDSGSNRWSVSGIGLGIFSGGVRTDQFLNLDNDWLTIGASDMTEVRIQTDDGWAFIDAGFTMSEEAAWPGDWGAGYSSIWAKNDTPTTLWHHDDGGTDHQLGALQGNCTVQPCFDGSADGGSSLSLLNSTISYDGTNLLINPQAVGSGYTDFTAGIFVAEDENVFSRFGGDPTAFNPSDANDMLVARKLRTDIGAVRRAGNFVVDVETNSDSTVGQSFGIQGVVYTAEANSGNNTRGTVAGGAAGGRFDFRHRGSGQYNFAGGVAAQASIQGGAEDGTMLHGYGLLDIGGDGGDGVGGMAEYSGLLIQGSTGNIDVKYGINIKPLLNATTSYGIKIGATNTSALWLTGGTGTASGIGFGTGAGPADFLYQSASGTLATDSKFLLTGANQLLFRDSDISIRSGADGELQINVDGKIAMGSPSIGADLSLNIEADGDTYWFGEGSGIPYGSMYNHDGGVTVNIVALSTPTQILSGFTQGEVNLTTFGNAREITVSKAGRYKSPWQISFTTAVANQEIEGGVMVDGVADLTITAHRKISTATDTGSISATGILDLDEGAVVSLWVANESSSTVDVNIEHANMTLTMVGGT